MVIENNTILYFSGTGNSLQVAKDLQNELKDIKLLSIASLIDEEEIIIKSKILGIVFPVYYARPPLIVTNLVKKLKIDNETYVFAAATYGGGPAHVLVKLDKVLQANGSMLNSGFLVRMPGNYIFNYGAFPLWLQNSTFAKAAKKAKKISQIIKAGKNQKYEVSKLKIDTLIDKISSKSSDKIMNNFHTSDKNFRVTNNCISCKLCVKICPVNNIEFDPSNKPIWKHNCEQCMSCIQFCPKEAIQWGNKTVKRKRYRNPNITVSDMLNEN